MYLKLLLVLNARDDYHHLMLQNLNALSRKKLVHLNCFICEQIIVTGTQIGRIRWKNSLKILKKRVNNVITTRKAKSE